VNLIEIDDVLFILQFESDRTASLKEMLSISRKDELDNYSFFLIPRDISQAVVGIPTVRHSRMLRLVTNFVHA
jgi:hypothetical protein